MNQPDLSSPPSHAGLRSLVRWGIYPLSWLMILSGFHLMQTTNIDPRTIWAASAGVLVVVYLVLEFLVPYEKRWQMTWKSFFADIRFVAVNSVVVAGFSTFLGLFAISTAGAHAGPASQWPLLAQLASALVIFELCNYTLHRTMHEGRGLIGRFLWRSHAAHHLPPRLYLVMHAVFHPINGLIIQGLAIILPIWLMGYSPKAVAMFFMVNGMHGLISHFNVDVRMGWMNYIFVGPELHRYHHSADVHEAKNYGATLAIFDLLFGTFVYRPGVAPKKLGVDKGLGLPGYERILSVLALPFRRV